MRITYTDKVQSIVNPLPDVNQWKADDANEVKNSVNTLYNNTMGWYNVTSYGLVGDGTTDNSTAFQSIIDSAPLGSVMYFPAGTYMFLSSIFMKNGISIIGDGTEATKIQTTSGTIILFDWRSVANGGYPYNMIIKDIGIYNSAASPSAGCGILIDNGGLYRIENLYIEGFYDNIISVNGFSWTIDKLYSTGQVDIGLYLTSSGVFTDIGDGAISNSYFGTDLRNALASIYQVNGGGTKITNSKFNWGGTFRSQFHYYYNGTGSTVDLNISNCSFENYSSGAIRLGRGTGAFEQFSIVGNDFGTGAGNAIILNGVTDGFIVGNTMRAGGTNAIHATNCDDIYIWNQYQGWSSNFFDGGGNTNIKTAVESPLLSPSNDDILQRKSGVWTNRTIAQLATDLGVTPSGGYKSVTGADTLTTSDYYKTINCSGTSADYTVGLPTAVGISGVWFRFVGAPALTKIVTIDGNSSETINGLTTRPLANRGGFVIVSDGSNWVVANETPSNIAYTPGTLTGFATPTAICNYSLIGKMMTIHFSVTSAAGSGTTAQISIPSGFTANTTNTQIIRVRSNTYVTGMAFIAATATVIEIYSSVAAGGFTNGQAREAYGSITFEVQ